MWKKCHSYLPHLLLCQIDIHLQKWKFIRPFLCTPLAVTLCMEGCIKPSNRSCRHFASSNITPYALNRPRLFQCVSAANDSHCLGFVDLSRWGQFRKLPTFFFQLCGVKSSSGNISITQQQKKKESLNTLA